MNKSKILGCLALAEMVLLFLFLWWMIGDPRMSDGALEFDEANVFEIAYIMQGVLVIIASWVYGVGSSFSRGSWSWFLGILFMWPLAPVYLLIKKP